MKNIVLFLLCLPILLICIADEKSPPLPHENLIEDLVSFRSTISAESVTNRKKRQVKHSVGPYRSGIMFSNDQYEAILNDESGEVITVLRHYELRKSVGNKPKKLDIKEARKIAENILDNFEIKHHKKYDLVYENYTKDKNTWSFVWRRTVGEYVVGSEALSIMIGGEKGELLTLLNYITDRKVKIEHLVTRDEAKKIARKHAETLIPLFLSKEFKLKDVFYVKMGIEYPNWEYHWNEELVREKKKLSPMLRLVYVFKIESKYLGRDAVRIQQPPMRLWVDARTGEIIGGE